MADTTDTADTTTGNGEGGGEQDNKQDSTFTQADVDRIVADRLKREREKIGDVKALRAAADELASIKESQKSEAQKMADQLAALQGEAQAARRDAARFKVAARFNIDDEDAELFLTGDDEDTLVRQAERLAGRKAEREKQGNRVPREGATSASVDSDERAAAHALFGG